MKISFKAKLLLVAVPTVLALAGMELALRWLCTRDADGNVWFRSTHLKPYRVTVLGATQVLARYGAGSRSGLQYDAELGWTQRPSAAEHNSGGFISSAPEVPVGRTPGRVRIALFGGSFTQGNFHHGWWRKLETELRAGGVDAEVLNFGVAGYGMDQAFLHWRRDGVPYRPDIVVFGFCAANCYDNGNLVRMLQNGETGIPFTKPRFLLEDGKLRLINSPTPPPEALPALYAQLAAWPLIAHDRFYHADDYRMKPWHYSRLLSLIEAKLAILRARSVETEFYRADGEASLLAERIVDEFAAEVKAAGSRFYVLHLPSTPDIERFNETGEFAYAGLYYAIRREHKVIATEQAMLAEAHGRPLREIFRFGHYTEPLDVVIARLLAEELRPAIGELGKK